MKRTYRGVALFGSVASAVAGAGLGLLVTGSPARAQAPGQSVQPAGTRVNAQTTSRRCDALQGIPSNVLLFPAVAGEASRCSATAGDILTEAILRRLRTQGAGVFPYSRSLPAVQRAVNEGLKAEEVAGPWDESRKGQRIAEMVGATEYITILVDDYKWDPQTRTVNFTVSLLRNDACDGAPLGTVSEKGVGQAPDTLIASCQESAAVGSAAEVVAEQVVNALLPVPKVATPTATTK